MQNRLASKSYVTPKGIKYLVRILRKGGEKVKGLIIKDPWITKILNGEKVWEIRGSNTKIRGTISLIKSGTGMIFGTVDLVKTKNLIRNELYLSYNKHFVQNHDDIEYLNIWAWILENPVWYTEQIPYKHKQGCVIWVNL